MKVVHRAGRWALAAAVAASLGFGATQALAAPAAERVNRFCDTTWCPDSVCDCVSGECVNRNTGIWCFA